MVASLRQSGHIFKCTLQHQGCEWSGHRENLHQHANECEAVSISCPNPGWCPIACLGCKAKFRRKLAPQHKVDAIQDHMDLLLQDRVMLKQELQSSWKIQADLEKKLHQALKDQAALKQELNSALNGIRNREFVWCVSVQSNRRNYFKSADFLIDDMAYRVFMQIKPLDGKPWIHGIFLQRKAKASRNVRIRYSFCLLDTLGNAVESTRFEHERVCDIERKQGNGCASFVDLSTDAIQPWLDHERKLNISVCVCVLQDDQARQLQCKQ